MRILFITLFMILSTGSAAARPADISADLKHLLSDLRAAGFSAKITCKCNGRHARRSYHYRRAPGGGCQAVDFRASKGGFRWLRAHWKHGLHQYRNGLIHADHGPRRSW